MKAKNGISLIVLVITIVVIIILAAAVILSLGDNNPINNSKVAQLTQTRDNLESAVQIYLSNEFTKCQGDYTADQILKGVTQPEGSTSTYTTTAIVNTEDGHSIEINGTTYYELVPAAAKTALGIDIPTDAQTWHLSTTSGKAAVTFTTLPAYAKDANGKIIDSVSGFVATK